MANKAISTALSADSGVHAFTEMAGVTGGVGLDVFTGSLALTDSVLTDVHSVAAKLQSVNWSSKGGLPDSLTDALQTALTTTLVDTTKTGTGKVGLNFSLADKLTDFLSAGETLTIVYTVNVSDGHGGNITQPVTFTITGSNDAPIITAASISGYGENRSDDQGAEEGGSRAPTAVYGNVQFTDADLHDTHTSSATLMAVIPSSGSISAAVKSDLATALKTYSHDDDGGSGNGVNWGFIAPASLASLTAGQTLLVEYLVNVSDNHGGTATQPITLLINSGSAQPVILAGVTAAQFSEAANTSGSATSDTAAGVIDMSGGEINDLNAISSSVAFANWSGGSALPTASLAALNSALTTALIPIKDGDGHGDGEFKASSANWSFSAADKSFDFLGAGETLTVVYKVVAQDKHGETVTRLITLTVTGTNDAPVVVADTVASHAITEIAGVTGGQGVDSASGALSFTDVDLNDTHTVANALTGATWSGGSTLPAGLSAALARALTTGVATDSKGTGAGSVSFSFALADKLADFLAAGETLTVTYNVTVTDNHGASSVQPVTFTITGTNDAPVVVADAVASHAITEIAGVTGGQGVDSASGALSFTDVDLNDTHTVANALTGATWSGGSTLPAGLSAALATALTTGVATDAKGTGAGSVSFSFALADKLADFLAAGETLTVTYNVTVTDNHGATSVKPVTFTITGTNDAPVVVADTVASHAITEIAGVTGGQGVDSASGALSFTDVDLNDTHTVANALTGATWSGGSTLPAGLSAALARALTTGVATDSKGTGAGSVSFSFALADKLADFLAAGETLTVTYNVTVTDNHGATSVKPVTFTITGTNDAPVVVADTVASHAITEIAGVTGGQGVDSASGALSFTDVDLNDTHTVANALTGATWSGGSTLPAGLSAALATALTTGVATDSQGTGAGSVSFSFALADKLADFLAAGETLTVTYNVTVTDNHGATSVQPVTFTITGTNDAPVVVADTVANHAITEIANATSSALADTSSATLSFTDVDLNDTHSVSIGAASATWSGGSAIPAATLSTLNAALTSSLTDSTHSGSGSIALAFSAADGAFDFLAAGETLTVTYNVTVTDNHGATSVQPVTFTITGTNDAPVVVADAVASHAVTEVANTTASTVADTSSATLSFTDVDLNDSHTVTISAASATWSGGSAIPAATLLTLNAALTSSLTDSTHSGSGSVALAFSAADGAFDFLAAGETLTVTYNVTVTDSQGATSVQPVTFTITGTNDAPVVAADTVASHAITEIAGVTGGQGVDSASGALSFTDVDLNDTHTVANALTGATWSGGSTLPAGLSAALATALTTGVATDSKGTGAGSVSFSFALADKLADFLAAGETLTVTYNVTVTDNHGATSVKPVTFTITGTNDAPVVVADTVASHAITEIAGVTGGQGVDSASGALSFTDVDLNDTHTVANALTGATWSGGSTLPAGLSAALATALTTGVATDSKGTGAGSVSFSFALADKLADFLAAGETLTVTYNVTVTDNHGATSVKPVTFTITGTNDAPVVVADTVASHAITEIAGVTGGQGVDSASGALSFTDVDLNDTHTVANALTGATWSGGSTLPAGLSAALATALTTGVATDSQGTGAGSVSFSFALADKLADFLAAGETLTVTYNVTVTDSQGAPSTQPVTFTITGTNDAPVVVADTVANHAITEIANATSSALADTSSATLSFTDVDLNDTHSVSIGAASATWSGGSAIPAATLSTLNAALTSSLTDSTHTGSGSIALAFSATDGAFDFLATGETLTVTYNVTVTDNHGATSVQPVTFTITGTNDAPVLVAGSAAISEATGVTGGVGADAASGVLSFTDVDLNDAHTLSVGAPSAAWSGGSIIPAATLSALTSALTTSLTDSAHTGAGQVSFNFNLVDKLADFLAAGETLTVTYNVTVADTHGGSSTQPITITITGTNDAPVLATDSGGANQQLIVNGGFDTGNFNGWSATSTESSPFTAGLEDGQNSAIAKSTSGADAWFVRAKPSSYFDSIPAFSGSSAFNAFDGSGGNFVLSQSFTLTGPAAKANLTFDFGTESSYSGSNRTFDVYITDAAGNTLQDAYSFVLPQNQTNWTTHHVSVDLSSLFAGLAAGTYTLKFVEIVPGNYTGPATFGIDNVSLTTTGHVVSEAAGATGSAAVDTTSGTLAFTDVDLSDTHTVSVGAASATWSGGAALPAATLAALASAMSATVNDSTHTGTGSIAWTLSAADSAFDFLAAGETLTVVYNLTVLDGHGGSSTQPVTITITGTNDAPVVVADAVASHAITEIAGVTGGQGVDSASGALSFTDVDLNDTHTVGNALTGAVWSGGSTLPAGLSAALATALTTGVAADSKGTGSGSVGFSFALTDKLADFLAAGETLTVTYNVTVTDNHGATSSQPVTFTITGTNDAPVVVADTVASHAITEIAGVTGGQGVDSASGALSFTDVDLNDTHTVVNALTGATWSGGSTLPAGLSAALATALTTGVATDSKGTGAGSLSFSFALADKLADFLAAGETLTVTYNVTVTDNHGATSTQPVTFTITGTNDAPVVVADTVASHAITELANTTGSALADSSSATLSYTDVDLNDTHSVSVSAASATWSGGSTVPAGTLSALNAALTSTLNDSTHTGSGSVALAFSAADGAFDFLAAGETLTVTYNVTVTDNHGATSVQPVTFTITGTNDAPVVVADTVVNHTTTEKADGTLQSASASLSFTDVDLNDTHSAAIGAPIVAASGFTVPQATLTALAAALTTNLTETKGSGSVGLAFSLADQYTSFLGSDKSFTVTYNVTVSDGHGGTSVQPVTFTVAGTNHFSASAVSGAAIENGQTVTLDALSGVSGGGTPTVSSVPTTLPAGVTYNASTHSFVIDPTNTAYQSLAAGETTTVTVNYQVSNGSSQAAASVSWVITGVNEAPVVTAINASATEGGAVSTINALANASDVDHNTTLQVVSVPTTLPAGVIYNATTKAFSFDPTNAAYTSLGLGQTTTVTVNYGVSDGTATTAASLTWTVTGVNNAPDSLSLSNSTVAENLPGVAIGTLVGHDPDTGDTLTYSINSGLNGNLFAISGNVLRVSDTSLSAAANPNPQVSIRVTDSHGAYYDQVITIHVQAETQVSLTTGTDNISGLAAHTQVSGAYAALNATDNLQGAGDTSLILYGVGSANLNQVATFSGFSEVDLINYAAGTSALTLKAGQVADVKSSGFGSVSLTTADVAATFESTSTGTVTLSASAGAVSATLTSQNVTITGSTGALNITNAASTAYLYPSQVTITAGSGAVNYTGTGFEYYTYIYGQNASGSLNINMSGQGGYFEYVYTSSGQDTIKTGGQYAYIYVNSHSQWKDGNVIDESGTVAGGTRQFQFSGTAGQTTDLAKSTFVGVQHLILNGDTFNVSSNTVASALDVTGSGIIQTNATALDLSSLTSSGVSFSSTNATGTTFTVTSAAVGFAVVGGAGQDTLVGKGFAFTADQRTAIFATTSIETITDTSGTYVAQVNPNAIKLTSGTDTVSTSTAGIVVNATATTLNTSDSLQGAGDTKMVIYGATPTTVDLNALSKFAGFAEVDLFNYTSGTTSTLKTKIGQALDVKAFGISNVTLTTADAHVTFESTTTGTVNLTAGAGQVDATLTSQNATITGSTGVLNIINAASTAYLYPAQINITAGSGAVNYTGTGFEYYTYIYGQNASGSLNINMSGQGGYFEYVYTSSGQDTIKTGGQYAYIYVNSHSQWKDGNVIDESGTVAGGTRQFQFSGTAGQTTDLAKSTFVGVQHLILNGDTFNVSSNTVASALDVTGSGIIQTNATALDLSSLTSSGVSFSSTNATGTTFTVTSAAVGFAVVGGAGQDTLVGKGFAFTADQRTAIFATTSIETITDTSGTYVAQVNPNAIKLTSGTDTVSTSTAGIVVNATATTLNTSDSLQGAGDTKMVIYGATPTTVDLNALSKFAGFAEVDLFNYTSGTTSTLKTKIGQALDVKAFGISNVTLTTADAHVTFESTTTGTVNLTAGAGQVDATLTSQNATITGSTGVLNVTLTASGAYLYPSQMNVYAGSGTLNYVGSGFEYYTYIYGSTGLLNANLANQGGYYEYIYTGAGQANIKTGGYYAYVQVNNDGAWHDGNVIDESATVSYGTRQFQFNGTAGHATDLAASTFTGVQHLILNGDTFNISSNTVASAIDVTGTGIVQTNSSALDLSSLTSATVSFASTNAAGTTFTVTNASVAFDITGGSGHDTIVGKGFTFSTDQRAEIFATTSVEVVTDASGTYGNGGGNTLTARSAGDVLVGGSGADILVSGVGNDTMTGNGGSDTFVFSTAAFGKDTINDFSAGTDVLQFSHNVFADAATAFNHAAQVGSDVLITFDANDTVTLKNVSLANLHASDFHIV